MQLNTLWLELPVDAWRVSSPAESLKTAGARLIDRLGAGKNTPKCAGHSPGGGEALCLDLLPKAPWDRGTVLPHPRLPSPSARLCELLLIAPGP